MLDWTAAAPHIAKRFLIRPCSIDEPNRFSPENQNVEIDPIDVERE
jgi:hypothetical protein